MKIQVEWKASPMSGITEVELSDLDVKTKREWEKLTKEQQRQKINFYLKETDQIFPKAIEWVE